MLGLNESEVQLVRQFAAARLQAENEAQAFIMNDPLARREATDHASAQFQTRLVNTLNESQMQRYFQLLAEASSPTIPVVVVEPAPAADTAAAAVEPAHPYQPIGDYHRRRARRH